MKTIMGMLVLASMIGLSMQRPPVYVQLKLALSPERRITVHNSPVKHMWMSREDGGYVIRIGNRYLSGEHGIEAGFVKSVWEREDTVLGTKFMLGKNCLTMTTESLDILGCYEDSDFRSSTQLFRVDVIGEAAEPRDEPYRRVNYAAELDRSVEDSMRRYKALLSFREDELP
jgi:hypothetical protein